MLAMTEGDYGGYLSHNLSKDPSNPGMVKVTSVQEVSTLEKMDWKGFSSSDTWYY